MSLATRCAACGTVFRVVQDQLKVSEGWVRCGRCDEVFNALEGLFDLTRERPPEAVDGAKPMLPHSPTASNDGRSLEDRDESVNERERATRAEPAAAVAVGAEAAEPDFSDATFPVDIAASEEGEPVRDQAAPLTPRFASPLPPLPAPRLDEPSSLSDTDPAAATATPDFLKQARHRAPRRSGCTIGVQWGAAVLLAAALGAQIVHRQRDALAASGGAGAASMSGWCRLLGCTIGLPRRIDDIAIESSALTPVTGSDALRLSVVIRNRGSADVAQPWIDLSLTDPNGRLVARRALAPRDFRVAPTDAGIRTGADAALELLFTTGEGSVGGYAVEVFYP